MQMDYFSQQLEKGIPGASAEVTGDGSKFEAVVISDAFEGASTINRHKMVYAVLNEHITSGVIHALTIKAHTPSEWEAKQS
ncbi:MAG: BolA/IbaG family iron-sulfur metabolism protein [Pseudomonadota bacterium]